MFLNSRWIDANPAVFRQLAGEPLFEIANHGTRHLPLLLPPSLFEHPAAELSVDDSAQLGEDRRT